MDSWFRNMGYAIIVASCSFIIAWFFGAMITVVVPDAAWEPWRVGMVAGLVTSAIVLAVGLLIATIESFA